MEVQIKIGKKIKEQDKIIFLVISIFGINYIITFEYVFLLKYLQNILQFYMVKLIFISIAFFAGLTVLSSDTSGQRIDTVFSFSNVPIRNGVVINYFKNSPKSLINYVDGLIVKNVNENNDSVFALCDGLVKILSIESKGYMCFINTNDKVFIYSLLKNVTVKNDSIIKCGDYLGLLRKSMDTMDSELQLTITTSTRDFDYIEQVEIFKSLVNKNCTLPLLRVLSPVTTELLLPPLRVLSPATPSLPRSRNPHPL